MTSDLNPYQAWLGLPPSAQPPNHYELLGLPLYDDDTAAVSRAAADRRASVMTYLDGPQASLANKLLGEIYVAEHFLKDTAQKSAYDDKLKAELSAATSAASSSGDDSDEISPAMRPEDFLPPAAAPSAFMPAAAAPAGTPQAVRPVAGVGAPYAPQAPGYSPAAYPAAAVPAAPYGMYPQAAVPYAAAPAASAPVARGVPMAALPAAPPVGHPYYPSQTDAAPAGYYAGLGSQTIAAEPLYPPASGASFAQPAPSYAPQALAASPVGASPLTNTETASAEMEGQLPAAAAPGAFVASAPAALAPLAAAPLASAPLAAPVAAIPTAAIPGAAVASKPIAVSPAAASPAIAAEKRPRVAGKKATPMWVAAGVPAALVVVIGLVVLYATGTGPFSNKTDEVAQKSPGPDNVPALHAPPVQPSDPADDETDPPPIDPEADPLSGGSETDPEMTDPESSDPETEPGDNIPGVSDPPATSTDEPTTDPPATDPPTTDPPTTDPPTTTTDPPTTDPPTTTTDPPTPNPPTTDPPTTDPPATTPDELSEAELALVMYHINAARYHLAQRDVEEAKTQIAAAQRIDTVGTTHKEIDRVKTLSFYVEEFWKAAKAQVDGTPLNNTMKLKGKNGGVIEIILVEKYDDGLLVKQSGANRNYKYSSMPSGLALGLAETWLNNEANSDVILGAFLCVNPTSDKDDARGRWASAAASGPPDIKTNVEALLPELEIKYPEQLGEPPAVASTDPPMEPMPGEPTPMPMPAGEAKPDENGRFPELVGSELKEAEVAFQEQYKDQLAAAPFDSDKAELARTLVADAAAEGLDPTAQFVLLDQARQMASAGGDFTLALEATDALGAKFAIDIEETKVDILAEAVKTADTPEANADLTKLGMKLAEDFALAQRYDQALRAARWAKTTAGKAKDTELLKQANELYTLIDEEKKNAG